MLADRKQANQDKATVILKFGGTSMGSFSAMQCCAEIILDYALLPQHHRVPSFPGNPAHRRRMLVKQQIRMAVVVSAVSGVTDSLYRLCAEKRPCGQVLGASLRHKHLAIVEECAAQFQSDFAESFCTRELQPLFSRLDDLFSELSALRLSALYNAEQEESDQILQAQILAMGEKLSSRIFAFVLKNNIRQRCDETCLSVTAISIPGEGLLASDNNYLQAKLDFVQSKQQIVQKLPQLWQEGFLPVVAGFTAADKQQHTTLLGRGGSDFSAAILAAALGLPTLDIWTDVAGIYSSDPRLVPQARLWPQLSFAAVSEMAYSGAKVVHPKSISIALQNQVAVIVRSTFAPEECGTLILPDDDGSSQGSAAQLAGLVLSHDSLLLHMENPNMLEGEGYIAQIANAAHRQEIPIDVCATSETSFSFSIHHADCNQQLLDDLRQIGEIRKIQHLYKLCCVGQGIGSNIYFITELLQQCQDQGIFIETISVGASHTNVTLLFRLLSGSEEPVRKDSTAAKLLRRLHAHFLEDPQNLSRIS